MAHDQEPVRALQERAAMALPAERVEHTGGWWLRHAPGCAPWVGSVLPHGRGDLARRVAGAERFYATLGARPRFQISQGACPPELDTLLAERGYRRESPMSLQVAVTARVRDETRAGAPRIRLTGHPTRAWFEAWQAVHGSGGTAEWDLLTRVRRPSGYACAMLGEDVVAVGRAVADTGWAGVFGMATLPEARGKGAAGAVLAALGRWAGTNGAGRMYLQVERDNGPASGLYARAGFTELCGYHYRTAG